MNTLINDDADIQVLIDELYTAVFKSAISLQMSVRQWCIYNGISYSSFHNLVHHPPYKQGKLCTYIKVAQALDNLKGGVRNVE